MMVVHRLLKGLVDDNVVQVMNAGLTDRLQEYAVLLPAY